ncbi:ribonuclease P protein component [Hydrogenispora ethanolica]|uniref:ribonuclease P protein component n=1 Tax=Hydrogenispora ethanolica TaxID=1082276 RepID=UPI00140461CA|nr:ribonuclease P protein component [Hydrogenispora ethanolica]
MDKYTVLKKNNDFQIIFEKGHSLSGRYIVVYFLPNALQVNRYGFCVGKKIGSAVVRNRIKRVLRAVVMNQAQETSLGVDFVIIARNPILTADFSRINDEISHILGIAYRKSSQAQRRTEDSR